jgi:hypothetical protein
MRPLDDKKDFQAGDSEDQFRTGSFPLHSPDEEMETELSEEELAAEMEPFTRADWNQEFPNYTAQEYEAKLPDRTSASWMAPVVSCLFGTLLGAAMAGGLVGDLPRPRQITMFFVFFLVLALLLSCAGYLFFFLRAESVTKKMKDEQESLVDSEPIHPK